MLLRYLLRFSRFVQITSKSISRLVQYKTMMLALHEFFFEGLGKHNATYWAPITILPALALALPSFIPLWCLWHR